MPEQTDKYRIGVMLMSLSGVVLLISGVIWYFATLTYGAENAQTVAGIAFALGLLGLFVGVKLRNTALVQKMQEKKQAESEVAAPNTGKS
jgi:heme/copper-type cytochrome/quinol oxidase subunit 3